MRSHFVNADFHSRHKRPGTRIGAQRAFAEFKPCSPIAAACFRGKCALRSIAACCLLMALCACGKDIRKAPLADYDLNDPSVITMLQGQLAPTERPALATYALIHWPGSQAFCGSRLVDSDGREPETIGDAIRFTLVREQSSQAKSDKRLSERRQALIRKLEDLSSRRDLLVMLQDTRPRNRAWTERAGELHEINIQIINLRNEIAS